MKIDPIALERGKNQLRKLIYEKFKAQYEDYLVPPQGPLDGGPKYKYDFKVTDAVSIHLQDEICIRIYGKRDFRVDLGIDRNPSQSKEVVLVGLPVGYKAVIPAKTQHQQGNSNTVWVIEVYPGVGFDSLFGDRGATAQEKIVEAVGVFLKILSDKNVLQKTSKWSSSETSGGDYKGAESETSKGGDKKNIEIEIHEMLDSSHQVILTGAPGTGKTYLAKKVAMAMLGESYANKNWDDAFGDGRVGFCQFHPSYDYSDFVEGLRPVTVGNGGNVQVGFKRMDGVFKKFCKQAVNDKDNNYVFVIDEINRGDISKIFGELFFSIDPGYRGTQGRVNTQYQNLVTKTEKYTVRDKGGNDLEKERDDVFFNGFYVPGNVYIIGTMNDIDRSVESMDFAIRRRFVWQEVPAKSAVLDSEDARAKIPDAKTREEAKKRMDELNDVIEKELGSEYAIGPAYFFKLPNLGNDFKKLWTMNLMPLLREYLRGNSKEEIAAKMEKFEKAYDYDEN